MNLIKAKLSDLDPALLDPDTACTEEAAADPKVDDHGGSKEAEDAGSKVAEQVVPPYGDQGNT